MFEMCLEEKNQQQKKKKKDSAGTSLTLEEASAPDIFLRAQVNISLQVNTVCISSLCIRCGEDTLSLSFSLERN